MKRICLVLLLLISLCAPLHAAQSTITDAEGYACLGDDKSRRQTEQQALAEARRNAVEKSLSYIKSETQVKDFQLEKDLVSAYANASLKIVQELEKGWYKDASSGDCYKIAIQAEVTPDEKAMQAIQKGKNLGDDPSLPLNVQLWTDKKAYRQSERIKIYLKSNKPFFARILYKDAGGNLIQLLPNPFRRDNYFNGGVIYELPSGNDRFELEVSPPFGEENIIVYTSTAPLGDLQLEPQGEVYQVKTAAKDIGMTTRGVKVSQAGGSKTKSAAEFFEDQTTLNTGR
ncbi:MAG: DUF4384 domain-containing protein [Deltaproteobacteria bacterium]|nr:DUF4384 domain-containing protein [Deltaproteobacteria bacterium]